MRDVWLDPTHASKWDADPLSNNPQRGEQLDLLLDLIADHYLPGTTILDVGCGSGLVEERLFRRLPEALVLGVDYSPAMIAMAEERLVGKDKQFTILQHDLNSIEDLRLPIQRCQVAFSVQAIHNLVPANQRKVISWVRSVLVHPGFFFFLDRTAVPSVDLFSCYRSFWNHFSIHPVLNKVPDVSDSTIATSGPCLIRKSHQSLVLPSFDNRQG